MLKIRLRRVGAKRTPGYRVVVADSKVSTAGKVLDTIGTYNPMVEPSTFSVDKEKVEAWIKKGAKPTERVAKLLSGKPVDKQKTADVSESKETAGTPSIT
jgi:small subunit ribosomal protein S16